MVAPLIALILLFGFYPKPVLDVINPAVERDHAGHRGDRPGADRGVRSSSDTAVANERRHLR